MKIKPEMQHSFVLSQILKLIGKSGYSIEGASHLDSPTNGAIKINMVDMNETVREILKGIGA